MDKENTNKNSSEEALDLMKTFMQGMVPQVKVNKNGYEIRTQILELASSHAWQDYQAQWGEFTAKTYVDPASNKIVHSVEAPSVPGSEEVLEIAQKFYNFVNSK